MIKIYTKDNKSIEYKVVYKKIKHVYFRRKDDVIVISANKRLKEKDIFNLIDYNFNNIYKMYIKNTNNTTNTFQLWGKEIEKEMFYKNLAQNEENYYKILEDEILKKIDELKPNLLEVLKTFKLNEYPIKVKPLQSKFGSAHLIKKYITINSFLAKVEPVYLYYVLIHEYAHFIVPNHSKRFYDLLDLVLPNHKLIQKNLRKHIISFF